MARTTYVLTLDHELDDALVRRLGFDLQVECERDGVQVVRVSELTPGMPHYDACRLLAREIMEAE